ncbi:lantibiotic dehydratase [Mucilaginibacter sp. AW1-7]|jgi:thiopeptide-type bacteriocin biosynthesis protein|uniref:lantibiotic dehydratase n=1 Tax=Mucilaginibacter sp. AW1-7 TaxID=3349874 RepID=UPI003F732A1E
MDEFLPLQFSARAIARNPVYSYIDYNLDSLELILTDTYFRYAVYLANPSFYRLLSRKDFKWGELNDKEKLTLNKYYNRMSFRPTPFGAFSSYSVVEWSDVTEIDLVSKDLIQISIQPDQEVIAGIAKVVGDELIYEQKYRLNPTIYKVGREYRYIWSGNDDAGIAPSFTLESIEANKLTSGLMEEFKGSLMQGRQIWKFIVNITSCNEDQATEYFEFLRSAQVIKPEQGINMIGTDFLKRLANFQAAVMPATRDFFMELNKRLEKAEYVDVPQLDYVLQEILGHFPGFDISDIKTFYYANSFRDVIRNKLGRKFQLQLYEGINCLVKLCNPSGPPGLEIFQREFLKKYDRQKVPLLLVLDPETGIGYGGRPELLHGQELLTEIKFPNGKNPERTISWSETHRILLNKWLGYEGTDRYRPINLDSTDFELFTDKISPNLPPSLPVIFRIFDDEIYIESLGGVTGTSLIGRFAALNDQVRDIAADIAETEEAVNSGVVFADISLLSYPHVDNINKRAPVYSYEIPINTGSELPENRQIPLNDLWLSFHDGRMILESQSLKRIVIPRLTSAYNHNNNELAVFRFLCDLQYQGIQTNFNLDMESHFPEMNFYPRICFKKTILTLAKWVITGNELELLQQKEKKSSIAALIELKTKCKIPERVALTRHDQQLVFNLDKEADQYFFLQSIKGLKRLLIQEFIVDSMVASEGKPVITQFIGFLVNKDKVYQATSNREKIRPEIRKRSFSLGGKWLYLKIYCSPQNANMMLLTKIFPFISGRNKEIIQTWFFVRYKDSAHHIRLRLLLKDSDLGIILKKIKSALSSQLQYQVIKEYHADTYNRELERYGSESILAVEKFFCSSSVLTLLFLRKYSAKPEFMSIYSFGFLTVHLIINTVFDKGDDGIAFIRRVVDSFFNEFGKDQALKIDLDSKYRSLRQDLNRLIADKSYFKRLRMQKKAADFKRSVDNVFGPLSASKIDRRMQLAADLIHMHLNRLFSEQQREQEFIIYFCLLKYKISAKARLG